MINNNIIISLTSINIYTNFKKIEAVIEDIMKSRIVRIFLKF